MREERIRLIVEVALSVALAAVLGMFKLTLPWNFAGGSVSLSMLPLIVISLRRGLAPGIVAGLTFGVIDYLLEPYFVHPVQVVLDYPVAFAACGLAALARPRRSGVLAITEIGSSALGGAILAGAGRLAASFVSGVVFFSANAPEGQPVWLYSLLYNASYLAPSVIACGVAAAVVVPALDRAVPISRVSLP